MSATASRIRGFDGLRAVAFLLVFLSHKVELPHRDAYGDVGVWLFFALSGFLITRILAHAREGVEAGHATFGSAIRRFYLRRTARIFPVYYAVLCLFTLASLAVDIYGFDPVARLSYWFYAANWMIAARNTWPGYFGHLWSLAIEEQFYLLLAPLVLAVPRARTLRVLSGFVLVGVATKVALEVTRQPTIAIDVNSFVNFALLGLGGIVGLNAERPIPGWLTTSVAQITTFAVYVAVAVTLGGAVPGWPMLGKLSGLVAGLIVLQLYRNQQGALVRFLERPPLRAIGTVSYGGYLFHPFVHSHKAEGVLARLGVHVAVPHAAWLALDLAITLGISGASYRFFEKPILDWAARRTGPA